MDFEKIKDIVVDTLSCDEDKVTPEANFFTDLGADSLDAVQLGMAVEDAFGITISDEDLPKIRTVADMMNYIETHLA